MKDRKEAPASITIDGRRPLELSNFTKTDVYLEFLSSRQRLEQLWDELIATHGGREFAELGTSPERVCYQSKTAISYWLYWAGLHKDSLCSDATDAGIGDMLLAPIKIYVSLTDATADSIIEHIQTRLIPAVNLLHRFDGMSMRAILKILTAWRRENFAGSYRSLVAQNRGIVNGIVKSTVCIDKLIDMC